MILKEQKTVDEETIELLEATIESLKQEKQDQIDKLNDKLKKHEITIAELYTMIDVKTNTEE